MKKNILDLALHEMKEMLALKGLPEYRAKQIYKWLYKDKAKSFLDMTNLSLDTRNILDSEYEILLPKLKKHLISKKDKTEKYLWGLADGEKVESVLIRTAKRNTVCVSTQVGCKVNCPFCASGQQGFNRNLTLGEITGQVLAIMKMKNIEITNIVFMGMGEPLDNYDNLKKAIITFNDSNAFNVGARKITVSTSGIIPGINKLGRLDKQIELAISLHASTDETRNKLVPINKKYPINDLINACDEYLKNKNRIITIEYIVMPGINDTKEQLNGLAGIATRMNAKINLIGCNTTSAMNDKQKKQIKENTEKIAEELEGKGINVIIRSSKGEDILAACGQLAGEE